VPLNFVSTSYSLLYTIQKTVIHSALEKVHANESVTNWGVYNVSIQSFNATSGTPCTQIQTFTFKTTVINRSYG